MMRRLSKCQPRYLGDDEPMNGLFEDWQQESGCRGIPVRKGDGRVARARLSSRVPTGRPDAAGTLDA